MSEIAAAMKLKVVLDMKCNSFPPIRRRHKIEKYFPGTELLFFRVISPHDKCTAEAGRGMGEETFALYIENIRVIALELVGN
jgi:hypothetical protein